MHRIRQGGWHRSRVQRITRFFFNFVERFHSCQRVEHVDQQMDCSRHYRTLQTALVRSIYARHSKHVLRLSGMRALAQNRRFPVGQHFCRGSTPHSTVYSEYCLYRLSSSRRYVPGKMLVADIITLPAARISERGKTGFTSAWIVFPASAGYLPRKKYAQTQNYKHSGVEHMSANTTAGLVPRGGTSRCSHGTRARSNHTSNYTERFTAGKKVSTRGHALSTRKGRVQMRYNRPHLGKLGVYDALAVGVVALVPSVVVLVALVCRVPDTTQAINDGGVNEKTKRTTAAKP